MVPVIYSSTEQTFDTLGIGALTDAISCEVEEERNGSYELTMEYPITGKHYEDIEVRRIILAQPNFTDDPQPFRIYRIDRTITGVVTVYAQHVSYDLGDFAVSPFTATGITASLTGLINHLVDSSDSRLNSVTLDSDISNGANTFKVDVPSSLRSWFGGQEGSLIDVFGGEWKYDKWDCYLKASRGADRGVVIKYGKNLIDLEAETKSTNVYTHMYGYWSDGEGTTVTSSLVTILGSANYVRILTYDFSDRYDSAPTSAQLTTLCQTYIANNNVSAPADNVTLDFVQLNELKQRVDLCDTVTVEYEKLGISVTTKCIRTKWDVLKDRYTECEFGESRNSIAGTIASATDQIHDVVQANSVIANAVTTLSGEVANAKGFFMTTATESDNSTILYLHDKSVLANSAVVVKITAETASWSTDGGTTWNAVIDAEGRGIFQHLYTVGIAANYITSGTIQGPSDSNYWNLNTGEMHIGNGAAGGWTVLSNLLRNYNRPTAGTASTVYEVQLYAPSTPSANTNAISVLETPYDGTDYGTTTANFFVKYDGRMYAKNAYVEGTIVSNSATITGGSINMETDADTSMITLYHGLSSTVGLKTEISANQIIKTGYAQGVRQVDLTIGSNSMRINAYAISGGGISDTPQKYTIFDNAGVTTYDTNGECYAYTRNGIRKAGTTVPLVIAQGSSGGWTYRKWNNGWCECWCSVTGTVAITTAWGAVYEGTIGYFTFPVTFASAPHCIAQLSGNTAGSSAWLHTAGVTDTTTTPTYMACRATSASMSIRLSIYAYGYVSS